jgi:GTP-binding protein
MQDLVLELFLELEASEEQFNAPFLFGSAKDGYALNKLDDEQSGMTPLFEVLAEKIPAPTIEESDDFKMLVSNVDWSDYVGRIAVGKILSGQHQNWGHHLAITKRSLS